jgi:hypothetical protein
VVNLPTYDAPASSWQLADFLRLTLRTEPAADGTATVDAGQLDDSELWLIDHAVIQCGSATQTTLRLYESFADPLRLLSGSDRGNFDEADYPGGLQLAPSASLVAVWSGATAGARGVLSIQGRIMRRA